MLLVVFCGGIESLNFFPGTFAWQTGIPGYILPAFCLGLYPMCYIARLTRSSMLDAMYQEYVKTARAKVRRPAGLSSSTPCAIALIPVITYLGPLTAFTLCGGFVVEKVFHSRPGPLSLSSRSGMDYSHDYGHGHFSWRPLSCIMNLMVDILYKVVDPRINLAKGGN